MRQRFTIEDHIAPPMRRAITLVDTSGIVVYVAQPAFGPKGEDQLAADLLIVATRIAAVLR